MAAGGTEGDPALAQLRDKARQLIEGNLVREAIELLKESPRLFRVARVQDVLTLLRRDVSALEHDTLEGRIDAQARRARENEIVGRLLELIGRLPTDVPAQAPAATIPTPTAADVPAVFLAEVTDDLEPLREQLQAHLEQAGFATLPREPYPRDHAGYLAAVQADLARSCLFAQLLSELPGKKLAGSTQGFVAAQHEAALARGLEVAQWRRRELDLAAPTISDDHRRRLQGLTVVACDFAEFKPRVVASVRQRLAPPAPPARIPGDGDQVVFIDAEITDEALARQLHRAFTQRGFTAQLPVWNGPPDKIRKALETFLQNCDALLLVHGDNPGWPLARWNYFLKKVKATREAPLAIVALCEGPPPDKEPCGLAIPNVRPIDCRQGFSDERFEAFLRDLSDREEGQS